MVRNDYLNISWKSTRNNVEICICILFCIKSYAVIVKIVYWFDVLQIYKICYIFYNFIYKDWKFKTRFSVSIVNSVTKKSKNTLAQFIFIVILSSNLEEITY